MKKKNVIIIVLCIVVVALVAVVAFLIGKNNSNQDSPTASLASTNAVTTQATTLNNQGANVDKTDIIVIKKYKFLEDDDFKMILVLENTGKSDAAVAAVGKIYDGANAVVGTERESVFIDSGAQTVVSLDFDTEGVKVMNDDYSLSVANATTIKPGIKNIVSKTKVTGNIVTLTSKNTGNFDLEGVEANILFYDGDELVDIESEDVENEATEIFEKGTTQTQRFDTKEPFKNVKVYYTQTQDTKDDD